MVIAEDITCLCASDAIDQIFHNSSPDLSDLVHMPVLVHVRIATWRTVELSADSTGQAIRESLEAPWTRKEPHGLYFQPPA